MTCDNRVEKRALFDRTKKVYTTRHGTPGQQQKMTLNKHNVEQFFTICFINLRFFLTVLTLIARPRFCNNILDKPSRYVAMKIYWILDGRLIVSVPVVNPSDYYSNVNSKI